MITTINLLAEELNASILKSIKEAYKGKNIEIIISDTKGAQGSEELLRRITNLRKDKRTVSFTPDNFFKTYKEKIADASNKI